MEKGDKNLPVPSGPLKSHKAQKGGSNTPLDTPYAAQILGGGEKRGLKGGPLTIKSANSTYLKSEYSGQNDRRPRPGMIKKTEI